MLELVKNEHKSNEVKMVGAIDVNQSHQFIDSLIQQIQKAHTHEIWNAQINDLMSLMKSGTERPKYLTAL